MIFSAKPKALSADQLEANRLAYHEASHAVMCYLFNREFEFVTILPSPGYNGRVEGVKGIKEESKAYENALILLAGISGESLLFNQERAINKNTGDYLNAMKMLRHLHGPEAEKGFIGMRLMADYYLSENWQKIETVSKALLEKKTLTYNEVKELMT